MGRPNSWAAGSEPRRSRSEGGTGASRGVFWGKRMLGRRRLGVGEVRSAVMLWRMEGRRPAAGRVVIVEQVELLRAAGAMGKAGRSDPESLRTMMDPRRWV